MSTPLQTQLNNLKLATQLGWKSTVARLRDEIQKEMETLTLEEKILVMTELDGIKESQEISKDDSIEGLKETLRNVGRYSDKLGLKEFPSEVWQQINPHALTTHTSEFAPLVKSAIEEGRKDVSEGKKEQFQMEASTEEKPNEHWSHGLKTIADVPFPKLVGELSGELSPNSVRYDVYVLNKKEQFQVEAPKECVLNDGLSVPGDGGCEGCSV